jgi:hypothetical protein
MSLSNQTRPKLLDWQFLRRRRQKAATTLSRNWYVRSDDWITGTIPAEDTQGMFPEEPVRGCSTRVMAFVVAMALCVWYFIRAVLLLVARSVLFCTCRTQAVDVSTSGPSFVSRTLYRRAV